MSEERKFEVNDRRKSKQAPPAEEPVDDEAAGGEVAAETADQAAADAPETSEIEPDPLQEDELEDGDEPFDPDEFAGMANLDVNLVLVQAFGMLHTVAWCGMGLLAHPATGKVQRDINEARRAIDAASDLLKHLEPHLSGPEQKELQRAMTDLRLNFVRQSSKGSGEPDA